MDVITFPENRSTTSGLQILLHGVISLPDAASYDTFKVKRLDYQLKVQHDSLKWISVKTNHI